MLAKEYFESVRNEVIKFRKTEQRYIELCSLDIKAISYEDGYGSGISDPMARIDERIDFEQIINERGNEIAKLLDDATAILYGESSRGGLCKLKGIVYADCICLHYLNLKSWIQIARDSGSFSAKQARNYAMAGMRFIDAHGFAYVKNGGE